MKKYNFSTIEKKWQKAWEKSKIYRAKGRGKKWYSLIEFPYPSGEGLHVGHVRSNTAMDVVSRKRRMEGYDVLYPIGWDAFGLPTENYAIKTNVDPAVATKRNTDNFRRQLKSLGFSFDWDREINTTDPEYYKWTQWMFLKFFEKGLAYKAAQPINWCPKDKIGLANEEAVGGICDRCGGPVETRMKEQWMIKITAYADKLLEGLKEVDYIPQAKIQQENWIGKSEGSFIRFAFAPINADGNADSRKKNIRVNPRNNPRESAHIEVFTTRPDTLFGATFLVISPELAKKWVDVGWQVDAKVRAYVKRALENRTTMDNEKKQKTGIFSGIYAINPANKEKIPVWVSGYVLAGYGTGAVMAVPAHDERDFEFAKKFKLPIRSVIDPVAIDPQWDGKERKPLLEKQKIVAVVERGDRVLTIQWGAHKGGRLFVGGTIDRKEDPVVAARREITEETGYDDLQFVAMGDEVMRYEYFSHARNTFILAHTKVLYFKLTSTRQKPQKLDDHEKNLFTVEWVTKDQARQEVTDPLHRYAFNKFIEGKCYSGTGILANSGVFSGMDSEKAKWEITKFAGGKRANQYRLRDWVFSRQRYWGEPIPLVHCEKCGWVGVPEKELPVKLPKVKNYKPRDDGQSPLASVKNWVNVMCPRCRGPAKRETDTMPNWAGSSWYFLAYCIRENLKSQIPISKQFRSADIQKKLRYWMPVDWYNGGMEHTVLHLLYSRFWNRFLHDQKLVPVAEPYKKRTSHGLILAAGGVKMSKSKGNVINPDEIVKNFGADTLRLYEMFLGPFDQAIAWDERGILGVARFLERVWRIEGMVSKDAQNAKLEAESHKLVKKAGDDIERMFFNTAISAMMIFVNICGEIGEVPQSAWRRFLLVLAPFAPHIAEELWQKSFTLHASRFRSIHQESWPSYDPKLIKENRFTLIIQVNGRMRASVEIEGTMSEKEAMTVACAHPRIKERIGTANPKRVIYIPGRLINIVV